MRHVLAIAAGADAVARAAGQHGANKHALDARVANCLRLGVVNQLILVDKHFAGRRIGDVGSSRTAAQTLLQRFDGLLAAEQLGNMHAANRQTALQEAVFLADDNFLRNIDQTAGQIARVSGFHSRVGQSLTGTVRRQEELLHVQTLAEVCTNGQFHGLAGRRRHQAAHTSQLRHLRGRTAGAGVGEHANRVERIEVRQNLVTQGVRAGVPQIDDAAVTLVLAQQTFREHLVHMGDLLVRFVQQLLLHRRNLNVRNGNGQRTDGGVLVAKRLNRVQHQCALVLALRAEAHIDDVGQLLLADQLIDFQREHVIKAFTLLEAKVLRQRIVENQAAKGGIDDFAALFAVEFALNAHFNRALQGNLLQGIRHMRFVRIAEDAAGALAVGVFNRQVVAADNHVLRRRNNRLAVLRLQDVVVRQHQETGFRLCFQRQRDVNSHLVAVEVGVESGTSQRVQFNRLAVNQNRLERLNAQTVQRRRAVEQHGVILDDIFEDVPHLRLHLFHGAFGALDVHALVAQLQLLHDEGLEQLQRHFLGQTALMQLHFRADDDNGTAGIVNALAQQVLTETALLAAQRVRQAAQRASAGASDRTTAATVVNQRVHGFLQHTLLVADDDFRRAQFQQALQAVVAVDNAAVEVIQVRRGEAAAVQLHHRAQIRRDNRQDSQHHPFGLVAAGAE